MKFKNLENNLSVKYIEPYLELFANLKSPTRDVLGLALDMACVLRGTEYLIFGGYAVLSHLMQEHGEAIARTWRGSIDIDMAGSLGAFLALSESYQIESDRNSPNLKNKRTLKLAGEEHFKIDFYDGDMEKKFGKSETNKHFGIEILFT